jgi:hypothetical protein
MRTARSRTSGEKRFDFLLMAPSSQSVEPPQYPGRSTGAAQAHAQGPSTRWETIMETSGITVHHEPWNKGKIVGQKAPFKVKDIWALRVRLQMEGRVPEWLQTGLCGL